jgi:UDP-N-acetylglucosamine--N-acetylmuramyl-(pentapeptide) pyrophosphoryl-undecaprenol N-acetylglucosamine transferase
MKNSKRIAILTGGTGGHIFPAQAIAEELVLKGYKVTILANKNYQKFHSSKNYNFKIIAALYPQKNLSLIKFPLILFIGVFQSLLWFLFNRPQKVISFGSYATFPSLLAAICLKKHIILHEQNSILGKVNKIFAKYAKKIALSYKKTEGLKNEYQIKSIYIGNPVRQEIEYLRNKKFTLPYSLKQNNLDQKYFEKKSNKFNILILGGSGGAGIFGTKVPEAIKSLNLKSENLFITHQCHKVNLSKVKNIYKKYNIEAKVATFFTDIATEIEKSHLIISRAGSSAISEFICAKKPSILVPFAKSANNHQLKNAIALKDNNCILLIEEKNFNAKKMTEIINSLIENPINIIHMIENLKKLDFNSSNDISNYLLSSYTNSNL